jgi:hypothetical protein
MGAGGESTVSEGDRRVTLAVSYYGLILESGRAWDPDLTVVLGAMFGGGSLELTLVHDTPASFDEAVGTPLRTAMTKPLYVLQPYIAFEARPLSWLSTRLQLGVLWGLADPWDIEEEELSGPPRSVTALVASLAVQFGGHERAGDELDAEVTPVPGEQGPNDAP